MGSYIYLLSILKNMCIFFFVFPLKDVWCMENFRMVSVLNTARNLFQLFLITNTRYFLILFNVVYLKMRSEIFHGVHGVI